MTITPQDLANACAEYPSSGTTLPVFHAGSVFTYLCHCDPGMWDLADYVRSLVASNNLPSVGTIAVVRAGKNAKNPRAIVAYGPTK